MKEFYIGDFYNPEEEKEDWETYVRRKKLEEESQMSPTFKFALLVIFVIGFSYLYNFLIQD